jgi:predicted dehydrogenase
MNSRVKVGLIGIGGYGERYVEMLLSRNAGTELSFVGAVDSALDRCKRLGELTTHGVRIYSSAEALFECESVDLAIVSTPIHLHASHTCLALEAGANVLCEKPIAGDLADAARMIAAEREAERFVAIGYQWAFSPLLQSLKRDILNGAFGAPKRMKTLVYFPRPKSYFARNDWVGRIAMPSGAAVLDSPVNNANAHHLHNMLYLLGPTREKCAELRWVQTERYRANAVENFDTAAMRVMTQTGVEVLFYTTHVVPRRVGPICEMEFDDAVISFEDDCGSNVLARFHSGEVRNYGRCHIDHSEKLRQSVDAIRTGAKVACGIDTAMPHTLCVIAAHHSKTAIQDFPRPLHRLAGDAQDRQIIIEGLAETLLRCFKRNLLPAELEQLSWARSSEPVHTQTLAHSPVTHKRHPKVAVTLSVSRNKANV